MAYIEVQIFAQICLLKGYVCLPMFIKIVNVLDFHFKGQRFESNILASA